jgi:hypothetical protein
MLNKFNFRSLTHFRSLLPKPNPKLVDVVSVKELAPHNYYEAQVLSKLPKWKGVRMENYRFNPEVHGEALNELKAIQDVWYRQQSSNSFFKIKEKKVENYNQSTFFETDFYFKSSEHIDDCSSLFQGCVSDLHNKTNKEELTLTDKWVFVELTESPYLLSQKLFQLERAVRFLPLIDNQYRPEALCVLMNGDKQIANRALDLIDIPDNAEIKNFPLYIGWVPSRNIFTSLNNLETKMNTMETKMNTMETKMNTMETKMASIENLLKKLVIKRGVRGHRTR